MLIVTSVVFATNHFSIAYHIEQNALHMVREVITIRHTIDERLLYLFHLQRTLSNWVYSSTHCKMKLQGSH